ncbi:MAG: hypothetical protein JNL08_03835 [Planctomycetes bacterium]|nr:hypothetical protein [Planctomycetota bacterium]
MPSLLRRCVAAVRIPANELAFAVRAGVAWSRGPATLPHEDKSGLFAWLPADAAAAAHRRAARLERQYDLAALRAQSTNAVYAHNLALLEGLERLADGAVWPVPPGAPLRALDVGSGDFHYATALQRWLARGDGARRAAALHGVELDGHGVYRDGHSRADHARAHAALAAAAAPVQFTVGDAARLRLPAHDVVTAFHPFLTVYPLLQWGLPLSRFRPRRLLRALVAAVRPGGWLVVANQTATEFDRLRALLAGQPVELLRRVPLGSDLVPAAERTAGRVGSLWRRG